MKRTKINKIYFNEDIKGCPFCGKYPEIYLDAHLQNLSINIKCEGHVKRSFSLGMMPTLSILQNGLDSLIVLWNTRAKE